MDQQDYQGWENQDLDIDEKEIKEDITQKKEIEIDAPNNYME